jgi:hypothetical protein
MVPLAESVDRIDLQNEDGGTARYRSIVNLITRIKQYLV